VDIVLVATQNVSLAPVAAEALRAGKHVLVEKPVALDVADIVQLGSLAQRNDVLVRTGYNLRYHPAFRKAREIVDAGSLGPLMFIRAAYGHGGRVGYDKEWRADPKLSGGGELIDQGIHLIDLAGWFLGDFPSVHGHATTYFWDMPVDDNAFMQLRNRDGCIAWLHASCTEWKNHFSFEIYGRNGKLRVEGLGGSYGTERLYHYQMLPGMGPPDTVIYEFPRGDDSWSQEMGEFMEDIMLKRTPVPGLREAKAALSVVREIYRQSGRSGSLADPH
jgi:predicted dehydrogenase